MQKFIELICEAGLTPPKSLQFDSKIHRFSSNGKRNDRAGYYCLHGNQNDFITGFFGCWRQGIYQTWSNVSKTELNNDGKWDEYQKVMIASKKEASKQRLLEAQKASENALKIWETASLSAESHPYLKRKGIKSYGLRVDNENNLLIPLMDIDQKIHSLQKISANPKTKKYFLPGGIVSGHFYLIPGKADLYLVEGYATGASIHDATGATVYVAFSAGNLISVATTLRKYMPEAKIIIAADNDCLTDGNPGLTKAREAAQISGSYLVWPEFKNTTEDKKLTDFNDMHSLYGCDVLKLKLQEAIKFELSNIYHTQNLTEKAQKKTQGEELLNLAKDLYIFRSHNDAIFADIPLKNHIETWPIRNKTFKQWLAGKFYELFLKAPGSQTLNDVILTLEAKALHHGQNHEIFSRIGKQGNSIYLDLCDNTWQVIEIDEYGWRITQNCSIKFARHKGMLPLRIPERGGDINDLWKILAVKNQNSQVLILAWLLQVINPDGPFPLLIFEGPQGSSKSYTSHILRSLVDPSVATIRAIPKDERDLILAAYNGLVLAFDNISTMPDWLSDALCRIATGSGFSTRMLFSDTEETIVAVKRPVILNGINQIVTRHDLLDRAILINLEPIPEDQRKSEKFLKEQQHNILPKVLGALLDGISLALKNVSNTKLEKLPRMADFALWATAGIQAFGFRPEDFINSYQQNRSQSVDYALESDPVSLSILALMSDNEEWEGDATKLHTDLSGKISDFEKNVKEWPKSSSALGKKLVRVAVFLQTKGISIIYNRGSNKRTIVIRKTS